MDISAEELTRQFLAFREECIWIRICHRNYEVLFESDNTTLRLLSEVAVHFFQDLNRMMIEYQWLISSRILDPAVSLGRPNLTVAHINKALESLGLLSAQISEAAQAMERYRTMLKEARNRLLAHLDLGAVMAGQPRGAHAEGEYEAFLRYLQLYLDRVGEALGVGPLDIAPGGSKGDAVDLVRALRSL